MDQHCFDALTRTITRTPSRRDVLRGLAGAGLSFGLGAPSLSEPAGARRRRRRRCRHGKTRLSNGSCAIVCTGNQDCPSGCGCSNPNTEGARHCTGNFLEPFPFTCATTKNCPRGSHCYDLGGGTRVCMELCH
jgi:hypothetical protein